MKGGGIENMLLFLQWCDSEWALKLWSKNW